MPVTVRELSTSRVGSDASRDRIYLASGSDDDAEIIAAVLAEAPATHNGLPFAGISQIRPSVDYENDWEVWARYGVATWSGSDPIGPAVLLSFSTTGGTKHVTQSIETTDWSTHAGKGAAPNFNRQIGVQDGGAPLGTDVPVPVFNFNIRMRFEAADITTDLIEALYLTVGKVNDAPWSVTVQYSGVNLTLSFDQWQVLYRGAEAPEPNGDGSVSIALTFSAAENLTDYEPAPDWPTVTKSAWDYLWFYYRQTETATQDDPLEMTYLTTQPIAAYVEQVVKEADFTALGLPA